MLCFWVIRQFCRATADLCHKKISDFGANSRLSLTKIHSEIVRKPMDFVVRFLSKQGCAGGGGGGCKAKVEYQQKNLNLKKAIISG